MEFKIIYPNKAKENLGDSGLKSSQKKIEQNRAKRGKNTQKRR
jgi:hypothetical protein